MGKYSMHEDMLPGFRFHPTEEELLDFYLKRTSMGETICSNVISFLNIYHHDPSDLPGMAKTGEREWYFFVHRDRKHGHGGRPGRTTKHGFWKATGSDRQIRSVSEPKKVLGLKKTLVFYRGRAPRGIKTDWIMNEYRLPDKSPMPKEDIVLCKIYRKATSLKILEQRAAMEDHKIRTISPVSSSPPSQDTLEDSAYELCNDKTTSSEPPGAVVDYEFRTISTMSYSTPSEDTSDDRGYETWFDKTISSLPRIDLDGCNLGIPNPPIGFGCATEEVGELEVPAFTGDPFSTPLRNVWMDQWSPYANILDF